VRRSAQLRQTFDSASFLKIRGNVDTRLRKLDERQFDAIVLAAAGLDRLGLGHRVSVPLPVALCVPAPGQGIVAVETRVEDTKARDIVARISDPAALVELAAERAVVEALGGGCQLPLGALAVTVGGSLELTAVVASLDGGRVVRTTLRGDPSEPAELGRAVADQLVAKGGAALLEDARTAG
jgi:hydroxymethylbilane synthase